MTLSRSIIIYKRLIIKRKKIRAKYVCFARFCAEKKNV